VANGCEEKLLGKGWSLTRALQISLETLTREFQPTDIIHDLAWKIGTEATWSFEVNLSLFSLAGYCETVGLASFTPKQYVQAVRLS
jgi:hypothetical protein